MDKQGRLVLPKEWREKFLRGDRVLLRLRDDGVIEIRPIEKPDLTKYFDCVEVEIESDLYDWRSVKRELHEIR